MADLSQQHQHHDAASSTRAPTAQEFDIVHHPIKDTLLIVSSLLSLMVHKNNAQYNPLVDPITLFHSRDVPRISIEAYMARILRYIPFTNEVLLNMLVFLDRIGSLSGMEMDTSGRIEASQSKHPGVLADRLFGSVSPPSPSAIDDATSFSGSASITSSAICHACKSSFKPPPSPISRSSPQLPRCNCAAFPPLTHAPSCMALSLPKNLQDPALSFQSSSICAHPEASSDLPMIPKRGRDEDNSESPSGSNLFEHTKQQQQHPPKRSRLIMNKPSSLTCTNTTSSSQRTPPSTPAPTPQLEIPPNGFRINSLNIHRLLITCLMVATKFTSDLLYSNARYAMVGGLSLPELNRLELEFLFTIQFELDVKVEELQKVGNALLRFKYRQATLSSQSIQSTREHASGQSNPQIQEQQDQQRAASAVVSTSHHSNVMNTATGASVALPSQQQNLGRYSIPSPTSPRNGLESVRTSQTVTLLTSQSSSSSSSAGAPPVSTMAAAAAAPSTSAASASRTMVVVVSESCSQRPQLLSPPEEKRGWEEVEVQMIEARVHGVRVEEEAGVCPSAVTSTCSSTSSS